MPIPGSLLPLRYFKKIWSHPNYRLVHHVTNEWGRATSTIAKAVKARLLLYAASPLWNGSFPYPNWQNENFETPGYGKALVSNTYDKSKWERALAACQEALTLATTSGDRELYDDDEYYSRQSLNLPFVPGVADVEDNKEFLKNVMKMRYAVSTRESEGNKEIIWGLSNQFDFYSRYPLRILKKSDGTWHAGYSGVSPTLYTFEHFYTANGKLPEKDLDFTPSSEWFESAGISSREDIIKLNVGREPRFYLTVMWNRQWYHQAGREVQMMSNEQDGGPTHDAPQNGYLNRKKVSLEQNNRNGIHPYRPGILYRLGEAYLNYAEALNECDPGNPDILKYLNLIRERAGMPQYGTGKDSNGFDKIPLNGQDEVREAIYHERRVELCCENGLRYLDLRRWKKAEEVLNQPMYGMNFSGTKLSDDPNDDAAFFKRTQYIKRVYERKFYWYPIYQEQIDKDPTLVQAPFWDK